VAAQPATKQLRLEIAAKVIPHPDKVCGSLRLVHLCNRACMLDTEQS
jgi:hypothetical protein